MGKFDKPLTTTYIRDGLRQTENEFIYSPTKELNLKPVKVPKGFVTDFASVPWPACMLIPKDGNYNQAAVVHDYLYHTQIRPKVEADTIFLDGMKTLGVSLIKRHIMYNAVKIFGGFGWRKRTKEILFIRKQLENDGVEYANVENKDIIS